MTSILKRMSAWGGLICLVAASLAAVAARGEGELLLTNVSRIRALTAEEISQTPRARLTAVVTLSLPSRSYLWAEDASGGVSLFCRGTNFSVAPGDQVQVTGRVVTGDHGALIAPDEVKVLRSGTLPQPPLRTAARLRTWEDENRRVQVEGHVLRCVEHRTRWQLELEDGTGRFWADVPRHTEDHVAELADAMVRVSGVCVQQVLQWGEKLEPTLLVQSASDIQVLQAGHPVARTDPNRIPVRTISSLNLELSRSNSEAQVHIRGSVLDQRLGEYIVVGDGTGIIRADGSEVRALPAQERVDVWGNPAWDGLKLYLRQATFRLVESGTNAAASAAMNVTVNRPDSLPTLTTAEEVRELTPAQAAWKYPVHIRGVVTFFHAQRRQFYVQDKTAGIFVYGGWSLTDTKPGDLVEIKGVTHPGGYAPMVVPSRVDLLGTAAIPRPDTVTLYQLATGQYDSQWVEARGVVRSCSLENGLLQLKLSDSDGSLFFNIPADSVPANLVDSVVRIRGVCAARSNARRQLASVVVWSPSLDDLHIEEPGSADPFSLPLQPIVTLSQFRPHESLPRRVKVAGVVTLRQSDQSFFMQDANDGLQVFTSSSTGQVKPGDEVVASGYPALGDFRKVLRDAAFKVLNHEAVPAPCPVSAEHPLDSQLHDRWVSFDARLLNWTGLDREALLTLQLPGRVVEARCLAVASDASAPPAGSLLRLTGVYRVLANEARTPSSFQILVPSFGDVRVLERPSWWTLQHSTAVAGAMMLIVATALLWIVTLRRKVREQTATLRERLEREAALEQRCREIFDGASDLIFTCDLHGNITSLNPASERALRYHNGTGSQLTIDDVFAPGSREAVRQLCETQTADGDGTVCELELVARDGRRLQVEASTRRVFKDGKPVGFQAIARDVTERKRMAAALQQSEEKFRSLVEQSLVGVYIIQEGRFVYANPRLGEIFGYSPEEMVASVTMRDAVCEEDFPLVEQQVKRRLTGETTIAHYQFRGRRKGGSLIHVEVLGTRTDYRGRPAILGTLMDITERKLTEKSQEAIYRISYAANTSHNLDDLYRGIHKILGELMPTSNFFIAQYDPANDIVSFPYWVDQHDQATPHPPRKAGRGLTEYVLRTGAPAHISAQFYDELIARGEVAAIGARHVDWIGVPLKVENRPVGVMVIQSYDPTVQFSPRDVDVLQFVSTQVAMAIERKRAEAAVAEAGGLLGTLLDNCPDHIYFKDRQSRFVRYSKSFVDLLHLSAHDSLIGKSDFDLFTEEHARPAFEDEQRIIQSGEPLVGKLEKETHTSGLVTWALTTKLPWRDRDGNVIGTFGISKDVTTIKEAEEKLAAMSGMLEAMLENSPDRIYFKDLESRFVRCSKSFNDFHHGENLIGKSDFDIFTEEHARPAYEDEQRIIRTGEPLVGKLEKETHTDGRISWSLTNKLPWRDKDGNIVGTFGISKDITAWKEAELELAYERGLFQTLLNTFPDYIYFKDRECRFVRLSKSKVEKTLWIARQLYLSKRPADASEEWPAPLASEQEFARFLMGKTDFDTFDEPFARAAYEEEQAIMRTGQPVIGKLEKMAGLDGSPSWMLVTKMPWRDKDGNIIGTFGVSRDITALKEAEAKLEAAHERLIETSRLAGMAEVATDVLHNVGNVLNSVNVSCSLTIDRVRSSKISGLRKVTALLEENRGRLGEFFTSDPRGPQVPDYLSALAEHLAGEQTALLDELEQLIKHIDHIKQIVTMQQSYAKVAGVLEAVNPAQLVDDALHINAAALSRHDVQLRREFDPSPQIVTERHKVLQILVNLIRNAKYAMDDAKRLDKVLTIKIGNEGDNQVKIQVTDNGIGIPRENLTRIFSHGFTTRRNGHGFGLHSSALAVRELGGALWAESDGPGTGATFTLLLPQKPPTQSPDSPGK